MYHKRASYMVCTYNVQQERSLVDGKDDTDAIRTGSEEEEGI